MPPKRRKAPKSAAGETPAKKRSNQQTDENRGPAATPAVEIHELYRQCVTDGSENQRMDRIREWEDKGAIAEIIWPFLTANGGANEYFHGCHLLVLLISYQYWEGSFSGDSTVLDNLKGEEVIDRVLEVLLYKTESKDFALQTQIANFLVVSMASNNDEFRKGMFKHLTGSGILHWMPERRRELELKKSAGLRRKVAGSQKGPMWVVNNIHQVLSLLEGHSELGALVKILDQTVTDAEELTADVPLDVWRFLHRSLELLIDLLSATSTRLFLVTYLDSIHFTVRCRLAVGHRFAIPENLRLIQHLLGRIHGLLAFPFDDVTQKHLSKVDVVSMHHTRATMLQKMAYRHYPEDLKSVIYAGVGLLCGRQARNSYLERSFVGFSDSKLLNLLYKMRLIAEEDNSLTRDFMIQVLGNYLTIPPHPMDQLRSFPLYPTEALLWDHSIIPPSSIQLRATQVLALPKLNARFLSFQDYLLRNYELVRLESAYEIRADLVNVLKRVRPILRQSSVDDEGDIQVKTEFNGWSRMALELAQPFQIVEVQPPKLGETVSSRVTAEIVIDLEACGAAIRREWDEIGEFDNLFLVAIDASRMSGNQAPLLKDYHLRHGSHKAWDSDSERRVPDEEDSSFPERFGITLVRGCMVVQVRNDAGTVLSEPGVAIPEGQHKSTKRVFKVVLDSAQYGNDSKSAMGSDMYQVSWTYLLDLSIPLGPSLTAFFISFSNSILLFVGMEEKTTSRRFWRPFVACSKGRDPSIA
jgi:hypothetical protein